MSYGLHNRREMLRGAASGVIAASIASVPLARAAGIERIPIGLLGASHSHAPAKLRLLLKSLDFEVVGICDESAPVKKLCTELGVKLLPCEELFARSRAIAVEGPVRDHAPNALLALRAGKHVHVEKPPAANLKDLQEMISIAREKKLVFQTGYMWRYHSGFDAIIDAAKKDWLGEVVMVRANMANNLEPGRRPEWNEFAGGGMFELACHMVDAIVRLLGRPKGVTPFLRNDASARDGLKDNNVAILEYDRAIAVITNTAMQAASSPERSFEVIGTNGSAILQPIEPPSLMVDLATPAGPYGKGPQPVGMTYIRYEQDFVRLADAIRGERPLPVTLEEELMIHETLLKASGMS